MPFFSKGTFLASRLNPGGVYTIYKHFDFAEFSCWHWGTTLSKLRPKHLALAALVAKTLTIQLKIKSSSKQMNSINKSLKKF